jgi:hypothetical protein
MLYHCLANKSSRFTDKELVGNISTGRSGTVGIVLCVLDGSAAGTVQISAVLSTTQLVSLPVETSFNQARELRVF